MNACKSDKSRKRKKEIKRERERETVFCCEETIFESAKIDLLPLDFFLGMRIN